MPDVMNEMGVSFWLTVAGTFCWVVCFMWMYRISVKQDRVMDQLQKQGRRIEKLSRIEHDLIKEVHPQVGEIKDGMDEMIATVKENSGSQLPTAKPEKADRLPGLFRGRRKKTGNVAKTPSLL